jgi:hypothetical protein
LDNVVVRLNHAALGGHSGCEPRTSGNVEFHAPLGHTRPGPRCVQGFRALVCPRPRLPLMTDRGANTSAGPRMEHEISRRAALTASGLPAFLPVMAHGGDNGVGDNGTDAGFTRGDHVRVARGGTDLPGEAGEVVAVDGNGDVHVAFDRLGVGIGIYAPTDLERIEPAGPNPRQWARERRNLRNRGHSGSVSTGQNSTSRHSHRQTVCGPRGCLRTVRILGRTDSGTRRRLATSRARAIPAGQHHESPARPTGGRCSALAPHCVRELRTRTRAEPVLDRPRCRRS